VRKMLKKTAVALMVTGCCLASASVFATAHYEGLASGWVLQSYGGVTTTLHFTDSPCTNGRLTLDPADSAERNKLLWATVLATKASGGKMSFDYDVGAGDICYIRFFSVSPG
jgi:hypothetical protein